MRRLLDPIPVAASFRQTVGARGASSRDVATGRQEARARARGHGRVSGTWPALNVAGDHQGAGLWHQDAKDRSPHAELYGVVGAVLQSMKSYGSEQFTAAGYAFMLPTRWSPLSCPDITGAIEM